MGFYQVCNLIFLVLFLGGILFAYTAGERQGFENHRRLTRKHVPKYNIPSKTTPIRASKKELKPIRHRRNHG